jgi:hypothetical protein
MYLLRLALEHITLLIKVDDDRPQKLLKITEMQRL